MATAPSSLPGNSASNAAGAGSAAASVETGARELATRNISESLKIGVTLVDENAAKRAGNSLANG